MAAWMGDNKVVEKAVVKVGLKEDVLVDAWVVQWGSCSRVGQKGVLVLQC